MQMEREKSHYTQRNNKVKHRFLIINNGNQKIIYENSERKMLQFKSFQSPKKIKYFFPDIRADIMYCQQSCTEVLKYVP